MWVEVKHAWLFSVCYLCWLCLMLIAVVCFFRVSMATRNVRGLVRSSKLRFLELGWICIPAFSVACHHVLNIHILECPCRAIIWGPVETWGPAETWGPVETWARAGKWDRTAVRCEAMTSLKPSDKEDFKDYSERCWQFLAMLTLCLARYRIILCKNFNNGLGGKFDLILLLYWILSAVGGMILLSVTRFQLAGSDGVQLRHWIAWLLYDVLFLVKIFFEEIHPLPFICNKFNV